MTEPDAEPTVRSLSAGQTVFGRFVLERIVGRGGRGVVWRARDELLGETVALKFLPDDLRWDVAALDELKREARRARQLTHANIVRIHDLVYDGSAAAIAMEFVEGNSLAELRLRKANGVFDPPEIVSWLPQLCAALDYAHREAGVVHRDLKPANLLLTIGGVLKIADFGVACGLRATTRVTGTSGGTLSYMSPQQAMGEPPVCGDDLYALGATLYELLAGKPPFHSGDVHAQLMQAVPERLGLRRCAVAGAGPLPEPWERAIAKCLAKRPEQRPASAREFLDQLQRPEPMPRRPRKTVSRRRWLGLSLVAALLLGGVLWQPAPRTPGTGGGGRHEVTATADAAIGQVTTATPFTDFADEFDSALTGWLAWGEPRPQRIRSFQGRFGIFDNNGDGMYHSGITSLAEFVMPEGFVLEAEVFLNVMNPAGCHCEAYLAMTRDPERWMNTFGSEGDAGDGISMGLNFAGDACWGTPADRRRHTWFGAGFIAEDGQRFGTADELPLADLLADDIANRWVSFRIEVNAQREPRFYVNGKLCWAPHRRIHPSLLAGQRLVLKGRSAGSAGKAYHDRVRLRAPGAAVLPGGRADPDQISGVTLDWSEAVWETDAALPERNPAGLLTLSNAAGAGETRLRSRSLLKEPLAVFVDVQPLLQSRADRRDLARLGFSARRPDGTRRFLGVEIADGTAWLVDTALPEPSQRLRRLGVCTSGAWQSYALQFAAPGQFEVAGSLMESIAIEVAERPAGGWEIELVVRESSDGVVLRPLRVSGRRDRK